MDAKLLVVDGRATRQLVKLRLPVTVGRAADQWLRIDHKTVSRKHCELFERDGQIVVRDVGSENGTLVDGRPIQEAVLEPGHRLTIGPLVFEARYVLGNGFAESAAAPVAGAATPTVGVATDPTAEAASALEPPVSVESDEDMALLAPTVAAPADEFDFEMFSESESPSAALAAGPAPPNTAQPPSAPPAEDEFDFDAPTPFNPDAAAVAKAISEEVRDYTGPIVDEPSQEIFFADDAEDVIQEQLELASEPAAHEVAAPEDAGIEEAALEEAAISEPEAELPEAGAPIDSQVIEIDEDNPIDEAASTIAAPWLAEPDAPPEAAETLAVEEVEVLAFDEDEVIAFDDDGVPDEGALDEGALDGGPVDLEARTEPWSPVLGEDADADADAVLPLETVEAPLSFDDEAAEAPEHHTESMNTHTVSDADEMSFLVDALGPDGDDMADDLGAAETIDSSVVSFEEAPAVESADENVTVPWRPPSADTVPDWPNAAQSDAEKAGHPHIPVDENALDFHDVSFDLALSSSPSQVESADAAVAPPAKGAKGKAAKPAKAAKAPKADKPKRSWWPFGKKKADAEAGKPDKSKAKPGMSIAAGSDTSAESLDMSFEAPLTEQGPQSPFAEGHPLEVSAESGPSAEIEFLSEDSLEVGADADDFAFDDDVAEVIDSSSETRVAGPGDVVDEPAFEAPAFEEAQAEEVSFEMPDEIGFEKPADPVNDATLLLPKKSDAPPTEAAEPAAAFEVDEEAFEEPDGLTEILAAKSDSGEGSGSVESNVELDFSDDLSMAGGAGDMETLVQPPAEATPPAKAKRSWWPFGGKKDAAPKSPKPAKVKPAKAAKPAKGKADKKASGKKTPPAPVASPEFLDESASAMDMSLEDLSIHTEQAAPGAQPADDMPDFFQSDELLAPSADQAAEKDADLDDFFRERLSARRRYERAISGARSAGSAARRRRCRGGHNRAA